MCGFIGIIGRDTDNVSRELYDGLTAIQHRGQDSAGIMTYDGDKFHLAKGAGLVRDVFNHENMRLLSGNMGLGHVRYPTIGSGSVEDAQPFMVNLPWGISMAHNGNVINFNSLRNELYHKNHRYLNSYCDVEAILNVFAGELDSQDAPEITAEVVFKAVQGVYNRVQGSYSVVAMIAGFGMVAFRDPYGIKPIIMGERIGPTGLMSHCVASESVVLDLLDYHNTRDIQPGEAVFIDMDRKTHFKQIQRSGHRPCIFEWVYFARPDSFIDKISVYKTRLRLGERLAEEWKKTGLKVDVVMPVPESARPAALAMAAKLGVKFREGLVKNRYIGRTFIMPSTTDRRRQVRHKLNPIQVEFEGKDVLIVDDSIVRGTTVREIIQIARSAGANKVYFASYSAPLKFPCVYGIDMQTRHEFIARDRQVKEVCALIGADYLLYQPYESMLKAVREGNPDVADFCTACFNGDYPTGKLPEETLEALERERGDSQREFAFKPAKK